MVADPFGAPAAQFQTVRIESVPLHLPFNGHPPGAVGPCVKAAACKPLCREPMPFPDFLAARNKIAREAQADQPMPARLAQGPTLPRRRSDGPRLGEVLPTRPPAKIQQIIQEYRKTRTVATGSLIDMII